MRIRTDLFSDSYELYEDLGSGQFAIVKRCIEKSTGREYAGKFVTKRKPNSRKGLFREKILQEVEILSDLKHENIINLHDVFETQNEIILVIELVTGGELFEYISEKDHLTEEEAAIFIAQILEGVEHFHAQNIVHLDLKPENVMLLDRESLQIKVIDFGISRKLKPGEKVMETYGTPEFVAPEIIQYQPISTATDMWSIGVITYILLSGASPFLGDSKQETFANITNIDYSFDEEYFGHTSDLAKDFIGRLFVKDVRKRANIKQCLDHPWIKPLRKQDEVQRLNSQINMEHLKSFIARRRWKQSFRAVLVCNRIIRKSQLRLSSTLSLENINFNSFDKNLLDNGEDFALTALLCGAENGDFEYLNQLLKITSVNVNKENKNKKTALHMAASTGKLEIVQLLHQYKINLNAQDMNGENAIHYSARCNNIEAAKQIIEYLYKCGMSLDVQNKNGETALHIAARYGCAEIVRCLCLCGADLDLQDDQFESALHVATWHDFPDVVKYICHFGCDVNLRNKEGETALIVACARGCKESVNILINHKSDLSCRDKRGNTALHWAVRRHYTHISLMLIQGNCKMDVLDMNGESALHIACRENLLPVVQTMCALGCRVDIKNKKEMTPLHTATEKNEIDAVRCLCLAGLNLSITNKDGFTAEQLALNLKHTNIASLLSSLRREENREVFIEQLVPTDDPLRRIKVKVFGSSSSGKSTLIDSMKCSYIKSFFRKSRFGNKATAPLKYKKNFVKKIVDHNSKQLITQMSTLDLSVTNLVDDISDDPTPKSNVLDNYEIINTNYTKGIEINQCTFNGSNNFSIWEFSGYEPYKLFYDHFVGDQNCVHVIVYNLNQTQKECFDECVYWLEYLRSRITKHKTVNIESYNLSQNGTDSFNQNSSRSNSITSIPSSPTHSNTNSTNTFFINDDYSNKSQTHESNSLNESLNDRANRAVNILFIATHADLDKSCYKNDQDSQFQSEKASKLRNMIKNHYANDDLFDLNEKHFVLDARAAWVADIKQLIDHLIKLKKTICDRLSKCTMFLNRTLFHLQNWRKDLASGHDTISNSVTGQSSVLSAHSTPNTKYPVISLKHFNARMREFINPLASDEHLNELIQQLQLMGEIVFLQYSNMNEGDHMICFQPEWLCNKILGHLFSYERYLNVNPKNLNGVYTIPDLASIFADVCTNTRLLKDIFIALDLCAELNNEKTGEPEYEFPALNFLSESMPLAFNIIKNTANNYKNSKLTSNQNQQTLYVFNGFRLKTSMFHLNLKQSYSMTGSMRNVNLSSEPSSQLASIFFRIQVNLRQLTKSFYIDNIDNDSSFNEYSQKLIKDKEDPGNQSNQHQRLVRKQSKLDTLFETLPDSYSANSTPPTQSSPLNNLQHATNFIQNRSNVNSGTPDSGRNLSTTSHMNGALIDMELYQTRYCSRLVRSSSKIECLLSLDHTFGEFIELRACAPDSMREELFYFVQDLTVFIQRIISDTFTDSINLEIHYLNFEPKLVPDLTNKSALINIGVATYDSNLSPSDIINLQFDIGHNRSNSVSSENKLSNLICCGSEQIYRNLIHGIDLPLNHINGYLARMLSIYLDKVDPMGLDWSILAVVLGLQDILPKIEGLKSFSKTACVLNEWVLLKQEQATIGNFLMKIKDLGRQDINEMILSTIDLYAINICKDSGIQNSNQTLASIK